MLKLVGLGVIVVSGIVTGQLLSLQLEARLRDLESIAAALRALATEIEYARKPLPEAWRELAERYGAAAGVLFAEAGQLFGADETPTAGSAWSMAVRQCSDQLAISGEDGRILLALGPVLGTSSGADQVRHLRLVDERLAEQIGRAREDSRRRGRLCRSLGVLGGILAAVMLA